MKILTIIFENILILLAVLGIVFVIGIQIGISHGRNLQLKECPCCLPYNPYLEFEKDKLPDFYLGDNNEY